MFPASFKNYILQFIPTKNTDCFVNSLCCFSLGFFFSWWFRTNIFSFLPVFLQPLTNTECSWRPKSAGSVYEVYDIPSFSSSSSGPQFSSGSLQPDSCVHGYAWRVSAWRCYRVHQHPRHSLAGVSAIQDTTWRQSHLININSTDSPQTVLWGRWREV